MHAGALVQHERFIPVAPSAVKPVGAMLEDHGGSGEFATPRELTRPQIKQTIQDFAQAALRAKALDSTGLKSMRQTAICSINS